MAAVGAYAQNRPDDERLGLDSLLRQLEQRRRDGRDALLAVLGHKRTRKLYAQLERFVTAAGFGLSDDTCAPAGLPLLVRDAAGSALWSRLEAVHRLAPLMPEAPLDLLHELRIACKHLRYTLELFGPALGPSGKPLRNDLVAAGSMNGAKEKGQLRLEGKEYVVQDGDVMHFRFYV